MKTILCALVIIMWTSLALANTRLGLHVTSDELAIWQARRTDNVNTINGFTYQSIYQNRILPLANDFKGFSHPGADGYWAGWTGAGCAPSSNNQSWAVGRSNGA